VKDVLRDCVFIAEIRVDNKGKYVLNKLIPYEDR